MVYAAGLGAGEKCSGTGQELQWLRETEDTVQERFHSDAPTFCP